jgi:hypothetical protein
MRPEGYMTRLASTRAKGVALPRAQRFDSSPCGIRLFSRIWQPVGSGFLPDRRGAWRPPFPACVPPDTEQVKRVALHALRTGSDEVRQPQVAKRLPSPKPAYSMLSTVIPSTVRGFSFASGPTATSHQTGVNGAGRACGNLRRQFERPCSASRERSARLRCHVVRP